MNLIPGQLHGNLTHMRPSIGTRALFALALFSSLSAPALAEDKCKLSTIAKFPVVMDGPRATVQVKINGKDTRIWLDSGAFFNFMPKARAVDLGLKTEGLPFGVTVGGIGGSFTPELTTVHDFGIVGAQLHNVQFVVGGSDVGNAFLGSNLLGVFDTEFDLTPGAVNLFKEAGCGHLSMAYWGAGMKVGEARLLSPDHDKDHHIYVEISINGHALRAMLDTGAPTTFVGRHAVVRAGIDLTSPKVVGSMRMSGVGSHTRQSWIARTDTISIGGEDIHNSPIRVIDDKDDAQTYDVLLGMDFLIAHHVFVSQAQRKMFLTYNGGPIFSVSMDGEIAHLSTIAKDMGAEEKADEPTTADQFAGRGSARLTKGDAPGAISDFSEAIRLAPGRSEFLGDRATAYFRDRKSGLAARDIDAALIISPNDYQLLTRRAQIRLAKGDRVGALADTEAAAAAAPKGSMQAVPIVGLFERLGKADRGLALLDPVVALHHDDSRYANLLNARCWNRALVNIDLDRALTDCNAAIAKSGGAPGMLDSRALVHFRRNEFAAAIADDTAALAKNPNLAGSLYIRGQARIASGDKAPGMADIVSARTLDPAIDQHFAPYGLAAPAAPNAKPLPPAQPLQPGEDDEPDQ